MASSTKWLPLESNPEVMNKFLVNLGVPADWSIVDVISLDEELLAMVPKPVIAVLLLFPTGSKHEELVKKQEKEQEGKSHDDVYYMKQTIKNACGTVALLHAVANNRDKINMAEGSALQKFLESTKELSAQEKGKALEKDEAIGAAHEESAQEGQTEAPPVDEDVDLHFVAFVQVKGQLYELDGRRSVPLNHGPTSAATLFEDAIKVCRQFMARDPDSVRFTVVALASAAQ